MQKYNEQKIKDAQEYLFGDIYERAVKKLEAAGFKNIQRSPHQRGLNVGFTYDHPNGRRWAVLMPASATSDEIVKQALANEPKLD